MLPGAAVAGSHSVCAAAGEARTTTAATTIAAPNPSLRRTGALPVTSPPASRSPPAGRQFPLHPFCRPESAARKCL